jgi:hypothetical protein
LNAVNVAPEADPRRRCLCDLGGTRYPTDRTRSSDLVINIRHDVNRAGRWLAVSMVALGVLAAASAAVSYAAQFRMVYAAKRVAVAAALEAGIPDVSALIFAALGIALALHGKRAIRPRLLNVCAVATSVTMNVLAAGHGWRDLAIWALPPVAYALASDTAIGVVRAWTLARQRALDEALADDGSSPLAMLAGLLLWLLRLAVAPVSTLIGFRAWVLEECPVAPGRRATTERKSSQADPNLALIPTDAVHAATRTPSRPPAQARGRRAGSATKTDRFLALVAERYGPLAEFPIANVSKVCAELAPKVSLNTGAARTALRRRVQIAQNGHFS